MMPRMHWVGRFVLLVLLVGCGSCARHLGTRLQTEWHVDTATATPSPSTRVLRVLARSLECAGDRSEESLIGQAVVTYRSETIEIRFDGVVTNDPQTCPMPVPVWATRNVMLNQEIGTRSLLDTGAGAGKVRYPTDGCAPTDIPVGCPGNP